MAEYPSQTAAAAGIALCRVCRSTVRPGPLPRTRCPLCLSAVWLRAPRSLERTWALLITAVLCYIPANVYPIMTVVRFGRAEQDTILSGVVHLVAAGQWPIALVVFAASVVVPVSKIVILAGLLVSVHRRARANPHTRARIYRFVELIGRWSMIDVFMISIIVALVQIGVVASIEPNLGAAFFAAVVLTTMLAALSFDERLLWDHARAE